MCSSSPATVSLKVEQNYSDFFLQTVKRVRTCHFLDCLQFQDCSQKKLHLQFSKTGLSTHLYAVQKYSRKAASIPIPVFILPFQTHSLERNQSEWRLLFHLRHEQKEIREPHEVRIVFLALEGEKNPFVPVPNDWMKLLRE